MTYSLPVWSTCVTQHFGLIWMPACSQTKPCLPNWQHPALHNDWHRVKHDSLSTIFILMYNILFENYNKIRYQQTVSVDKFLQLNYTLYVMNTDFCYFISLFITHDQINISKLVLLLSKHYLLSIKLNELYVPFSIPNTLYKMLSSEWISIWFKAVKKHDINVLQLKVHCVFFL